MRHLIVLSGNSLKNKGWGELIVDYYTPQFDSVFMLEYDHWVSGDRNINFMTEESKLATHVATLPADTEITLFAKSAGSLLAFLAVNHGAIVPVKAVFFGIPFDLAASELFKEDWSSVETFSIPAIAFHNIEDPTTSYEFTKQILTTYNPAVTLITTHESDHWYGDVQTYDPVINNFLL